jgi:hypothetical protein
LRLPLEAVTKRTKKEKKRCQALLTINDLEMIFLLTWRDQYCSDEIFVLVA